MCTCACELKYHISSQATRVDNKAGSALKLWEVYWDLLGKLYWFQPRAMPCGVGFPREIKATLPVCSDIQAYKSLALSALSLLPDLSSTSQEEEEQLEKNGKIKKEGISAHRKE